MTRIAAEAQIPLTIGGGITSPEVARALPVGRGRQGLPDEHAALDTPGLLTDVARLCGRQAVVLGVDVMTDDDGTRRDLRSPHAVRALTL